MLNVLDFSLLETLDSKIRENQGAEKKSAATIRQFYTVLAPFLPEQPFEERFFAVVFVAVRFFSGALHPLPGFFCLDLLVSLEGLLTRLLSSCFLFRLSVEMLLLHLLDRLLFLCAYL